MRNTILLINSLIATLIWGMNKEVVAGSFISGSNSKCCCKKGFKKIEYIYK